MMYSMIKTYESNEKSTKNSLKRLFDLYADETISDEKIHSILEPILRMINEGMFDLPFRIRMRYMMKAYFPIVLIIVLVLVAVMILLFFSR